MTDEEMLKFADDLIQKQHMLIKLQNGIINKQKEEISQMEELLVKAQKCMKKY